ncbi:MAG: GNAT family N-acetyltransferase [Bacteroidetes bacterium]|nr:GNAT family N-acetyltransferase [Bacteroidota bacterium]
MFVAKISSTQQELEGIINLRYAVLRQPWNKPKDTATDELEETSVNALVEHQGEVIACGRLQNNGGGMAQIRYMAVHPDYQGKGLGKLVLKKLEEEARHMNISVIELQARENALEFYKSQNYSVKETSFKLWDIIQHYLMVKAI